VSKKILHGVCLKSIPFIKSFFCVLQEAGLASIEERGNTPAKALGVPERAELVDLS
jgi:hypothetical protein